MSSTTETVTHEKSTVSSKWWMSLINLQTLAIIGAGFASLVLFWNRQKDHGNSIGIHDKLIQELIQSKADQSDLKSVDEKVNRQYEQIRSAVERIVVVEKALEYERGKHDAERKFGK